MSKNQNIFSVNTDKSEVKGFISKKKLLEYVTEEDIFQLVLGFKPIEFEYITSPLREDRNPGCWIETNLTNGKLSFRDFCYGDKPLDCFDMVQDYFKIPNFYKTLEFIKGKLIDGKNIKHNIVHIKPDIKKSKIKNKVKLLVSTRNYTQRDKRYWYDKYEITKQNLIEDKVFPVNRFKMIGTRKGDFTIKPSDVCYAYIDFKSGNKKIYRPYKKNKGKFVTNCSPDDIGGIDKLISSKQLVITKSYKDYRVLKNAGLNVVWFQNEGQVPSEEVLYDLVSKYSKIYVFFDNDEVGKEASTMVAETINKMFPERAKPFWLITKHPKIKDPADFVDIYNGQELIKLLNYYKLL